MTDFNYRINRQGPRGPQGLQGEKGDPGNTFTVSKGVNTPTEYTLIFDGGDGNQFETDNLRNPIVDRGGTYVRYDRDNVTQYIGEPDMAVIDETPGIVNLAGKNTVTPNASDAVAYELLEKTVDELNTALENLDGAVDGLDGRLDTAEGDISQAKSDIVGLDNRVTTNEGNITSLQSGKADKSTTYTKTEVNNALAGKANTVHTHTVSQITDAGALASQNTVNYQTQVTNKPIIPTVGNGTITLTQGGVTKGTFTTNQSGNSTIDLDAGGGSQLTAGNAINISDDVISVKYDGTTIGLNASGQLQSLVEEPDMTQYYTKSQVDSLIPDISGKADSSDVGEMFQVAQTVTEKQNNCLFTDYTYGSRNYTYATGISGPMTESMMQGTYITLNFEVDEPYYDSSNNTLTYYNKNASVIKPIYAEDILSGYILTPKSQEISYGYMTIGGVPMKVNNPFGMPSLEYLVTNGVQDGDNYVTTPKSVTGSPDVTSAQYFVETFRDIERTYISESDDEAYITINNTTDAYMQSILTYCNVYRIKTRMNSGIQEVCFLQATNYSYNSSTQVGKLLFSGYGIQGTNGTAALGKLGSLDSTVHQYLISSDTSYSGKLEITYAANCYFSDIDNIINPTTTTTITPDYKWNNDRFAQYTDYATTQTAGLVKVGNNLSIAADGTLSADTQAPTAGSGISVSGTAVSVNVDNSTITINGSGELSANLPGAATSSTLGLVKPDNTTIVVDANGEISANIPTPATVDQTYSASSTNAQSGVAIAGAGFLTSVPTATTSNLGLVQPDGTSITINDGVISAAGSAPSNMVTTDTQQIITGRKDMAIINIQPSGSTGYRNYITPISSGKIAISKSTSYDTAGTQPGVLLDFSNSSAITSVAYGGNANYINMCTQYGNNTAEIRFCNGYKAGQVGSGHAGIGKYGDYTYIRNNNTNDKKVYKITTGGASSADFTNFLLEKDMLDGTTISYDSTTGKISTVGSFVPTTRTINTKPLSSDITLTAEDVGALPDDTVLLKQYSDGLNEYGDLVNTNGILSGFSDDNYASIPGNFFKPGHTIIIKFNFVTKTTARQYILASEGFLNVDINTNSNQLRTWDNSTSAQVNVGSTMTSGSDYYLKIVLKDTGKDFYLTINPSNWGTATTVADTAYLTAEIPNNQVYFGFNILKSNSYWNSTIDSNYIEIYDEDNILIYSSEDNTDIATISRLGVIKPDGTTLIIDKEGVLSANVSSGTGTNLTSDGNLNLIVSEGDIIEATDTLPTNVTRAYAYLENNTATCSVTMNNPDDIYTINSFYIDKDYLIDPTDFEIVLYQVLQYASGRINQYYKIIDVPNIVNLSWGWNGTAFALYLYNYYTNARIEIPNLSYTGMQYFDKAPEIKMTLKSNVLTLSINKSIVYSDNNFVTNTIITNNIGLEDLTTNADISGTMNSVVYLQKSYIKSGGQVTWGLCGESGVAKATDTTYGLVKIDGTTIKTDADGKLVATDTNTETFPKYASSIYTDYSNNTTPHTAPSDGYLCVNFELNAIENLYINAEKVGYGTRITGQFKVRSGDEFYISAAAAASPLLYRFYPAEEVSR